MDDMSRSHMLKFRAALIPICIVGIASGFLAPVFGSALVLLTVLFYLLSLWWPALVSPLTVYFANEIDAVAAWVLDALLCIAFFILRWSRIAFVPRTDRAAQRLDRTAATYWKAR